MRANVKSTGERIEVELFKGRYYRVMDENKLDEKRSWSAEELTLDTTRPSPGEELEQLASKPHAPSVVETPLCDRLQHAFVAEGTSSFYVQLEKLKTMERASTAAQLEVDRLKAEVAARYTVEEIRGWLRQKNTSMEGDAVVVKPTLGIAAFIANQRKEKGT